MKKMTNKTHIEGLLYQHNLEQKVSAKGNEYIKGEIEIATDNEITNIVPIHFLATSKAASTYAALTNIVNGTYGSVMADGVDKAAKLRIDSSIGLNDFYSSRTGELVSVKRNDGGFIHVVNSLDSDESKRNTFDLDIVITGVRHVDANEEKGLSEKAIVKGAIFDYKSALMPVELSAVDPDAIAFFESLDASSKNPICTRVKGNQVSETIVKRIEEESAFGAPSVREVKNTRKDFVITWAKAEPYEWDDESFILASDLTKAMAERETYLATIKKESEERKAAKDNGIKAASSIVNPAPGGFNF